ncbi:MAG: VCBS repeat-containing protein [Betaproteobacteria bacterium]|nr:VCBS repeat-containing protein [Betaproteobacteria bacterium]
MNEARLAGFLHRAARSLVPMLAALLSLPAQAQMHTPGQFAVSESGAASYTIPLQVPPGTAGMEPRLALTYNSQAGNGLLGMGWSLAGLSAIVRCPRTQAQDGIRGRVNYDANDRFCLDGQRLMVVGGGAYGAPGTSYRTERESFSKVDANGAAGSGPAYFVVKTKAGLTMEYGNTADSRIEAKGRSEARVWALNKVTDTKGNYFTIAYYENAEAGEYYPLYIYYTGNAAAGLSTSLWMQFVYDPVIRPDISELFHAGSSIKTINRLTKVQMWKDSGANLVREYRLAYDNQGQAGRSRVTTVSECDKDGTCLVPTQFAWLTPPAGANNSYTVSNSLPNAIGQMAGRAPIVADFNGDGRPDILWDPKDAFGRSTTLTRELWIGNGDGSFTVKTNPGGANGVLQGFKPHVADFNGDGRADIVWNYSDEYGRCASAAGYTRVIWLGNADGTFAVSYDPTSIPPLQDNLIAYAPVIADFNGDGRTDILWDPEDGYGRSNAAWQNKKRKLWLGNGDGTFTEKVNVLAWADGINLLYAPLVADFNGDGRADILWDYRYPDGRSAGLRSLWLANDQDGFDWVTDNVGGVNSWYLGYVPVIADFNGDGKADILWDYRSADGYSACVRILWHGKGDGNFVYPNSNVAGHNYTLECGWALSLGDFNGDGSPDVLWHTPEWGQNIGHRTLWLNRGDPAGTFDAYFNIAGADNQAISGAATGYQVPLVMDLDGDGKSDVVLVQEDEYYRTTGAAGRWTNTIGQTDMVSALGNGLGALTTITYKPLTDASVYTKEDTETYPRVDLRFPLQVVSSHAASNGIGGTYQMNYTYAGAKADLQGRGFLGFHTMTVADPQTGITGITTYNQTFPTSGLVDSVQSMYGSTALKSAANTYGVTVLNGGASRFVHLASSSETQRDLNGAFINRQLVTNQFDDWGNATQISVQTRNEDGGASGYSKTTVNAYTNDTVNWLLGRLTQSAVTSTTP